MPDLGFHAEGISPASSVAVPTLLVSLAIRNRPPAESIRSIGLNCQVRIHPLSRTYSAGEEARLLDLFGERERWSRTMTALVWTTLSLNVTSFSAQTSIILPLPCTMDFDVAAAKYFYGLEAGHVDLSFLFSGTVFYTSAAGALQIAQIPWDREARLSLPVAVWRETMAAHYGETAWLRLSRDCFDRLHRFASARGVAGWEKLLHRLMDESERMEIREAAAVTGTAQ